MEEESVNSRYRLTLHTWDHTMEVWMEISLHPRSLISYAFFCFINDSSLVVLLKPEDAAPNGMDSKFIVCTVVGPKIKSNPKYVCWLRIISLKLCGRKGEAPAPRPPSGVGSRLELFDPGAGFPWQQGDPVVV